MTKNTKQNHNKSYGNHLSKVSARKMRVYKVKARETRNLIREYLY